MLQITVQGLQKFIKALFWVFLVLLILNILAIAIGSATGHHSMNGLLNLFYFNSKYNFPIYFSVFCLLLASLLLYAIYRFHKQHDFNDSRYWLVLSIGFLYLSIDESIDLHGMLTNPLRSFFHAGGFLFYTWVIPGFIVCLILAIYFFPFFMRLSNRYKILFGLSIFLFVGGAVVLEVVTAYFDPKTGGFSMIVAILGTIKQAMEWVGELVFLYSLSDYIRLNMQTTALHPGDLLTD